MSRVNCNGLKDYIPADVAREVRRRCNFGCLFCRSAIIEYDHFDPEFAEATEHNPDGIVALCGVHHTARGNGQISVNMVKERLLEFKNKAESSKYKFELDSYPEILIGRARIRGVRKILEIDQKTILSFSPPESYGAPPLLNAMFYNQKGKLSAEIINNEWRAYAHNWDVVVSGTTYTVKSNSRKVALKLMLLEGKISITHMNLKFGSTKINIIPSGVVTVETLGIDGSKLIIPDVPTLTEDWLHWIKVNGKQIVWCTENIHELLADIAKKKMPLSISKDLGFSPTQTVMAIPKMVKPSDDMSDEWKHDNRHGEFENITLNGIALCPHSHSNGTTMYAVETKSPEAHMSWPNFGNLRWVNSARKGENIISNNPSESLKILKHFENALAELNDEGGKIHQWIYLMSRKIESLHASGDIKNTRTAYSELLAVTPKRLHNHSLVKRAEMLTRKNA
jgi:hypothetical protein